MYIINAVITRPNVNLHYYIIPDSIVPSEVKSYWKNTYKDTGKCIHIEVGESEDKLEMTNTIIWNSEQDYNEYKNDLYLIENLFSLRDLYWQNNNIVYTIINQETL